MGASPVDTTSQQRTHLFSNNCKICTKQQLPDDNKQVVKKPLTTQREEQSPLALNSKIQLSKNLVQKTHSRVC
jgi:hypothetical protein